MLVLTRKASQSVFIDGNITVTVLAVEGNRVRLGVSAPQAVSVNREELLRRALGPGGDKARPPEGVAV
jgi:carbon storage regulator